MNSLNQYNDKPLFITGHGSDIASQRADDLDLMAIEFAKSLNAPFAIDIACGAGGQAIRLAEAGARVLAIDIADCSEIIEQNSQHVPGGVAFAQMNMTDLHKLYASERPSIITCQRAIHYLDFNDLLMSVNEMALLLAPGGKLFISASGLHSELGEGYPHTPDFSARWSSLSEKMADKHGILHCVRLFEERDMHWLLTQFGLEIERIYSSPFGNIKAVATKNF